MITLHQIHKFYGKQDVLKDAGLHVAAGQRIGLVGKNGAGKSTILGLILGRVKPDSGEVFKAKNLRMGYLPQDLIQLRGRTVLELAMDTGDRLTEVEAELEEVHKELEQAVDDEQASELLARQGQLQTIFEGLGGYDLEARATKTLAGLGFREEQYRRDVGELSGGWLMRAALARILLSGPDLILLDEPTNHLDLESLVWLESHLVQNPASLILVSHDRVFLDKVVNRIVEVDDGRLYVYGGNYSEYEEQRLARRKAQTSAFEAQQEKIRQMRDFIDRNRSRKDRAKQVQGRLKALEKMEMVAPPASEEAMSFEMPPTDRSAKVVVELLGVDMSYGDHKIYQGLDFVVQREDRLALLGRNGQGKSTLLKLLYGGVKFQKGRRLVGGRVRMGVFSQHALEDLNPDNDVLEELSSVAGLMAISRLRSILGVFLFKGDEVFKKVRVLSGGERSRLVLAKLFMSAPNVLFLDEPTNHLDIQGREVLEKALKAYDGTIVLISHDRHLINAVATKVAYVKDGLATVFPGNYRDFQRLWKKKLKEDDPAGKPEPVKQAKPVCAVEKKAQAQPPDGDGFKDKAARKRAEAEARNHLHKKLKPLKDELAKLEKQVAKLETRLDELVEQMVDPEAYQDGERWQKLSKEHDEVKTKLDKATVRWEEVALQLEEAQ